jgi:hypothetical protein
MILYNVTVNISDSSHPAWLQWMRNKHIPDLMKTGLFLSYKMYKMLSRQPDETGETYCMQYFMEDMEAYEKYVSVHAPALQQEYNERFGGQYAAFRTILEDV